MEKKLYWILESNGDLSVTCESLEECYEILLGDFESLIEDEQKETEYTIYPTWLTEQEYRELPESNF